MGKHRSVKTSRQVLSLRIRAFGDLSLFGTDLPASMRNGKSTLSGFGEACRETDRIFSCCHTRRQVLGPLEAFRVADAIPHSLQRLGSFDEIDFGASGDPSLKTVSSVGITGACKCQITKVVAERKGLIAGNSGKSHKHRQKLLSHSHCGG